MSGAVKDAGYLAVFVPQCLIQSVEDMTIYQTIEWTSRQTVICRVYNPVMWGDLFAAEAGTLTAIISMLGLGLAGFIRADSVWVIGSMAALLLMTAGRLVYLGAIVTVVRHISPDLVTARSRACLMIFSLLSTPLIVYNSTRSWFNRKINWRGVRYHLRGPREVEVI